MFVGRRQAAVRLARFGSSIDEHDNDNEDSDQSDYCSRYHVRPCKLRSESYYSRLFSSECV